MYTIIAHKHYISTFLSSQEVVTMTYFNGQPVTSPLQVSRPASEVRIEKSLIGLVLAVLEVFFTSIMLAKSTL